MVRTLSFLFATGAIVSTYAASADVPAQLRNLLGVSKEPLKVPAADRSGESKMTLAERLKRAKAQQIAASQPPSDDKQQQTEFELTGSSNKRELTIAMNEGGEGTIVAADAEKDTFRTNVGAQIDTKAGAQFGQPVTFEPGSANVNPEAQFGSQVADGSQYELGKEVSFSGGTFGGPNLNGETAPQGTVRPDVNPNSVAQSNGPYYNPTYGSWGNYPGYPGLVVMGEPKKTLVEQITSGVQAFQSLKSSLFGGGGGDGGDSKAQKKLKEDHEAELAQLRKDNDQANAELKKENAQQIADLKKENAQQIADLNASHNETLAKQKQAAIDRTDEQDAKIKALSNEVVALKTPATSQTGGSVTGTATTVSTGTNAPAGTSPTVTSTVAPTAPFGMLPTAGAATPLIPVTPL